MALKMISWPIPTKGYVARLGVKLAMLEFVLQCFTRFLALLAIRWSYLQNGQLLWWRPLYGGYHKPATLVVLYVRTDLSRDLGITIAIEVVIL